MAYGPSPIKRDSVISQAAQEICRIIEAERLAPGETLPPETRLSQMLGISRNSVREALRVLHGLGYVEKAAGRRVVVTAGAQGGKSMFDESVLLEAAPIANEVRSHIAQKCAELSAERLTAAELGELAGALAALEQAIARQDLAAAKAAHDAFHGLLLASADMGISLSRKPTSNGDWSPSASQYVACFIMSFIEPVTERSSALANRTEAAAGTMSRR